MKLVTLIFSSCLALVSSVFADELKVNTLKAARIEISNLRHGLLNINSREIYSTETRLQYKENGVCTLAGKKVPCMYTGIEFDYKNAKPNSDLDCVMKTSAPVYEGDIYRKSKTASNVLHWQIHLANESGHLSEVGYHIKESGDTGTITVKMTCSYRGSKVFATNYSINFD